MAPPDPDRLYPLPGHDRTVFLKPLLQRRLAECGRPDNVEVGEFSYYDDAVDRCRSSSATSATTTATAAPA